MAAKMGGLRWVRAQPVESSPDSLPYQDSLEKHLAGLEFFQGQPI